MNPNETPRPPVIIVSVLGDNRAKANITVSNGVINPDSHPGPLLHAPTPWQVLVTPLTVPGRTRPTLIG